MKDAKGHGSNPRGGLTNAAQEKIAIGRGVDASRYPSRSPSDIAVAQTLGGGHPKSVAAPLHEATASTYNPRASVAENIAAFTARYGGPRNHAAEQRGFNSGMREINRLRRAGK